MAVVTGMLFNWNKIISSLAARNVSVSVGSTECCRLCDCEKSWKNKTSAKEKGIFPIVQLLNNI